VAAGQHARLKVYAVALEGLDHLERILAREGQVVVGVDEEDSLVWPCGFGAGEALVVADRADGGQSSRTRSWVRPASSRACLTWRVLWPAQVTSPNAVEAWLKALTRMRLSKVLARKP